MNDFESRDQCDSAASLNKIIADFEQLEQAIDSVLPKLNASACAEEGDLQALHRAREAARKGVALARQQLESEHRPLQG